MKLEDMKFKVGDRVRIIDNNTGMWAPEMMDNGGEVGTITAIRPGSSTMMPYQVNLDKDKHIPKPDHTSGTEGYWVYWEENLELVGLVPQHLFDFD